MKCPFCAATDTKVVDSRTFKEGLGIRRRRKCGECDKRFTTHETIELDMPMIVKNDGRREPYFKAKLSSGIEKACQKRPISTEQVDRLIENIEKAILERGGKEITSVKIGELVMTYLRHLDPVAYIRFASVYRNFKDVDEFVSELKDEESKFIHNLASTLNKAQDESQKTH